MAILLI